jgi:hypothetical protein
MKTQTQYITDAKGKKKAVILGIKEYERLVHALEELEDKKAFISVVHEKSIPYGEIESRLNSPNNPGSIKPKSSKVSKAIVYASGNIEFSTTSTTMPKP